MCACARMHLSGAERSRRAALAGLSGSQDSRTHIPGISGFKGMTEAYAGLTTCLSHVHTAALSETLCYTVLSIALPSCPN